MKKRFFSILLCLCMVLMLFPVTALADGEALEEITKIAVGVKTPILGENPEYSWSYRSTPNGVINVDIAWYRISKDAYTGEPWDVWENMFNTGYTYSEDYYYKVVCPVKVYKACIESYVIPNNVNATINGKKCDIQITDNGKSCQLSYVFEAQVLQPVSNIAVTLDKPALGKTPDLSPKITAFPEGSIITDTDTFWAKLPKELDPDLMNMSWEPMKDGEVFTEGYYYGAAIYLYAEDGFSFNENTSFTVNGDRVSNLEISQKEAVFVVIFDPLEPQYTLTVPFTTTVKLGGSAAPGETTFDLAVVSANGYEESYKDVTVSASVTTNGAGSYEGTMTFKGTFQQLQNMLGAGVFVQQVNAGAPNWTYDDTVWSLKLRPIELATDDTAPEYILLICPATLMTSDNGSYYVIDEENPVDEMQFTNTYTYSAPVRDTATIIIGGGKEESKPVEENPNTGAPVAANMSTLSVLTLAVAAVAVLKTRKR